jgi:hypothetical protein
MNMSNMLAKFCSLSALFEGIKSNTHDFSILVYIYKPLGAFGNRAECHNPFIHIVKIIHIISYAFISNCGLSFLIVQNYKL